MFRDIKILGKYISALSNPSILLTDHNNIMKNLIPHFITTLTVKKAKAVVLWQDVTGTGIDFSKKAKEMGKPVIVVQHGRWAFRDYLPPVNYELLYLLISYISLSCYFIKFHFFHLLNCQLHNMSQILFFKNCQ